MSSLMTSSLSLSPAQNVQAKLVSQIILNSTRHLKPGICSPLPEWYVSLCQLATYFHASIGIWGLTDLNTPNTLRTLDEIFDTGLKAGKDREFLGERKVISTNPLKFSNKFDWQTYGEVDIRRRHVGSALVSLFQKGDLGGGEFETVGIWSANRPGELPMPDPNVSCC